MLFYGSFPWDGVISFTKRQQIKRNNYTGLMLFTKVFHTIKFTHFKGMAWGPGVRYTIAFLPPLSRNRRVPLCPFISHLHYHKSVFCHCGVVFEQV